MGISLILTIGADRKLPAGDDFEHPADFDGGPQPWWNRPRLAP